MPLDPVFDIIAAIIVEEAAIPIFPKKTNIIKSQKFFIMKLSNKIKNKNDIAMFIKKTKIRLKYSLPVKITEGDAEICKVKTVPRSSSETNALESPDIAEKKITTQNRPPERYSEILSVPIEKRITLIVTKMNIAKALNAYLVLSSDFQSFRNIVNDFNS